jgi:bacterioferritin (cytochrome b1)
MISHNDLWILSFYRVSEIGGAMFFGRLSRSLQPGPIQVDMTKHFADEARHAALWTNCIAELGQEPMRLSNAYQDQYLSAAGMPANLMEVLAITQVFEQRVLRQYSHHLAMPNLPEPVRRTLIDIMADEKWHISWIRRELGKMAVEYGRETVKSTLQRFKAADSAVYRKLAADHREHAVYIPRT